MRLVLFQVRRAGLTEKTLDELEVARDITVRKRITKMYVIRMYVYTCANCSAGVCCIIVKGA